MTDLVMGDDYFLTRGSLYRTKLVQHKDGDYEFKQDTDEEGLHAVDLPHYESVYMNKEQAVAYAKLILRNEGIQCPE